MTVSLFFDSAVPTTLWLYIGANNINMDRAILTMEIMGIMAMLK